MGAGGGGGWLAFAGFTLLDLFRDLGASPEARDRQHCMRLQYTVYRNFLHPPRKVLQSSG